VFSELSLTNGRKRLKFDAVPSVFPWNKTEKRMSSASQKALQPPDIDAHAKHLSVNIDSEEMMDVVYNGIECVKMIWSR